MSARTRLLYIIATLLGGVFVLYYRGIGWEFIRGHVGDWLVVQLMYLVARYWVSIRWRFHLAIGIVLTGIGVEIIKFLASGTIPNNFFMEITLGSVFDPVDVIAFVLGVGTVLAVEQFAMNGKTPSQVTR